MTFEDVKFSIKNHILNNISYADLSRLCEIFSISLSDRPKNVTKNLIDSIFLTSDLSLLHRILYMLNSPEVDKSGSICSNNNNNNHHHNNHFNRAPSSVIVTPSPPPLQAPQAPPSNLSLNAKLYCLSNDVIDASPVNVRSELVDGVNQYNIFISNFTKYPPGHFNAPSSAPTLINGRMQLSNCQLPYVLRNFVIKSSPFYCCQVILHPVSLLIPKPAPNVVQTNRIMSKLPLQFTLSTSVRQLLLSHCSVTNNRRMYKWQVLLRFAMYDPSRPTSLVADLTPGSLTEYIPPYLSVSVNNVSVPLWEILPSNNMAKEGKRHSRPINISDHIKYNQVDDKGYRQVISVNWWQTPSVYMYYYVAVFLERKLDVRELLDQFVNKTHSVQRPVSFTLDFIREKFSSNNQFQRPKDSEDLDEEDEDLIISSVLPVSLQCPVGKSRISCPLRSVNCQHLQCFDAHLYLMMNERRSVWKCPVCDGQATLNELFVDQYFQRILKDFEHDQEVIDVNVNPDGSYVPVAIKESRDGKHSMEGKHSMVPSTKAVVVVPEKDGVQDLPVISLESDDDISKEARPSPSAPQEPRHTLSVKVSKDLSNDVSPSKGGSVAIDLTSDSEDDVSSKIPINEPYLVHKSEMRPPLMSSEYTLPRNTVFSQNLISIPKLFPKSNYNISDKMDSHSSLISENLVLGSNFPRIMSSTNRLLLPATKFQAPALNMSWMPPPLPHQPQSFSYICPKSPVHKVFTHNLFPNQGFHPRPPSNNHFIQTNITTPKKYLDHGNPDLNHIKLKLKYCNVEKRHFIESGKDGRVRGGVSLSERRAMLQESALREAGYDEKHAKKKNKKKNMTKLSPESLASRRSSRIQSQHKKQYAETSDDEHVLEQKKGKWGFFGEMGRGGGGDSLESSMTGGSATSSDSGENVRRKRTHSFKTSSSTQSNGLSVKKYRRIILDSSSSSEEVVVKSTLMIDEDLRRVLKYPVICIPRLEEDESVLKYFQCNNKNNINEDEGKNILDGLSKESESMREDVVGGREGLMMD